MTWILIYLMFARSSGPASMTSGTLTLFPTRESCEATAEQMRVALAGTRVQSVITCVSRDAPAPGP